MLRRHAILVCAAVALFLGSQATLLAQAPTGTILGTVRDPSSGVVPKATVSITNQKTDFKRSTFTNDSGDYQFTLVEPAPYTLTVEAPGFKKYVQPDVPLTERQTLRVDVSVEVGRTAETVTVRATVSPVNSESATITESYAPAGLENAPEPLPMDNLPTERIGNLSLQSVGVGSANYKVDGSRMNETRLDVDGRTSIYYGDVPLVSTQELKLISRNANAEYATPATIQTSTKGGSNAFHASADMTLYDMDLASLGPNHQIRKPTTGSWKGSWVGSGPVIIPKIYNGTNRTWFFVNYDRAQASDLVATDLTSLPTAAMQAGDFSHYTNSSGALIPIIDPLTGIQFGPADGTTAGLNVIPSNRINAVSAKIASLYPKPNTGSVNSIFNDYMLTEPYDSNQMHQRFWRFDQKISNNDTFNYTMNLTTQDTVFDVWASGFSKLPQLYNAVTDINIFSHAFAETHVFSPTMVNEARFAFDRYLQPTGTNVNGQTILQQFGIQGINSSLNYTGVPNIQFNDVAGIGEVYNPSTYLEHRFSYLDNLSWVRGAHTIKMGANYTRFDATSSGSTSNPFGTYSFTGRITQGAGGVGGSDWADFLLGYPASTTRFTPRITTLPFNYMFGAFIQDDWKIRPRLTINYGLRYDLEGSPVDKNGLFYGFDIKTGALVFPTQFAMSHVSSLFNPLIPLELASAAGLPPNLIPVDKRDFRPRLGVAFRPFNNSKSVIRAGYGIFTNGKLGTAMNRTPATAQLQSGGPFALSESFTNIVPGGGAPPTLAFPNPFLTSTGGNTAASYTVTFVTPNYKDAYVQQWNLTFEQEWWNTSFRFSYVGTKGTNLLWGRNIDQPPASTTPYNISACSTPGPRPNPTCRYMYYGFTNVTEEDTGGNSDYDALQVEFTHPFTKGFQLHGGYMWAKEITDVEESSYLGVVGVDPYNRAYDKGPSDFIPSQRFMFDLVWQLPLGRGKRFLSTASGVVNQIFGGWQVSWYGNYMTGTPFSVVYSSNVDPSGTGNFTGRADRIASGRVANPSRNNYFVPSAFVVPPCGAPNPAYPTVTCTPIGRFGNEGRNPIYGPTENYIYSKAEELALMKTFPLYKEKLKLTVSAYTINPFNRHFLDPPDENINDATVGQQSVYGGAAGSLYGVGSARSIILGGRLAF